jgi:hypothetical protein
MIRLILKQWIVPSAAPLQDTFVALADTVTLIGSPIVTVVRQYNSISIQYCCYYQCMFQVLVVKQ